ncbi:MAG: peptidylprolyl isomerase [Methylococcales bacterium]
MKQFIAASLSAVKQLTIFTLIILGVSNQSVQAKQIDQIVAVVENSIILRSELNNKLEMIKQKFKSRSAGMPPESELTEQVLERLVVENLQLQRAEKNGLVISEKMINQSIAQMAAQNNLSVPEFRQELANQGMDFNHFQEEIRSQLMIDLLRNREVMRRIKVTDQEIDIYLKVRGGSVLTRNSRYRIGHILLSIEDNASPTDKQLIEQKAQRLIKQLRDGGDFKELAILNSKASTAAQGGDLGWRSPQQIPSIFADTVPKMSKGEILDPIVNSSGYHIIKLLDLKGEALKGIKQTHARHILIKTDDVFGDQPAKNKIMALVDELENGADFAVLAKAHSDDKASALNGGDMDWVSPGSLVPEFETTMDQLDVNTISKPIKTKYGWHLIEVMERRESHDSQEMERAAARNEISRGKMQEETRLWLRQLRDEAYVELRI